MANQKSIRHLYGEEDSPAEPSPFRTQSNIMDDAMRAVYAAENGTYYASSGPHSFSAFRDQAALTPKLTPAHLAPGRAIYPPGHVPVDSPRVQSMAPSEASDASEALWRTWDVDEGRASHKKNWKQRFLN